MFVFVCLVKTSVAQTYTDGNRLQATSHQVVIPEDGSVEELKKVVFEWTEGVLKKCPVFENVSLLYQESTADTLELLVLYEFSSQEFEKSADQMIQEQIAKRWPNQEDFRKVMSVMGKYIDPAQNNRRFYRQWMIKP